MSSPSNVRRIGPSKTLHSSYNLSRNGTNVMNRSSLLLGVRRLGKLTLAHTVRNQTEAAYARSDLFERRRYLMDDWAAYLSEERGEVVRLHR